MLSPRYATHGSGKYIEVSVKETKYHAKQNTNDDKNDKIRYNGKGTTSMEVTWQSRGMK